MAWHGNAYELKSEHTTGASPPTNRSKRQMQGVLPKGIEDKKKRVMTAPLKTGGETRERNGPLHNNEPLRLIAGFLWLACSQP